MDVNDNQQNEFYVHFSSVDCPMLYRDNQANDFRVTWQTPKELLGRWKVALTDVQYNNFHATVNSSFGVEFSQWVKDSISFVGKLTLVDNLQPILTLEAPPPRQRPPPSVRKTAEDHACFKTQRV